MNDVIKSREVIDRIDFDRVKFLNPRFFTLMKVHMYSNVKKAATKVMEEYTENKNKGDH